MVLFLTDFFLLDSKLFVIRDDLVPCRLSFKLAELKYNLWQILRLQVLSYQHPDSDQSLWVLNP